MELLVFTYGIIIGSFLNVCIYRIPREKSIFFPQSQCTSCGYNLSLKELIPIFSYVFLKGKCRSCGEKISIRYAIIEAFNGILYLSLFLTFGVSLEFFKFCFLVSLLIVISLIDFETTYIYTSTTIAGIIGGSIFIIYDLILNNYNFIDCILGALTGFIIIGLVAVLTNGMGSGDIEVAILCGLFLGTTGILIMLFISFIIAGITGATILSLKLKNRKDEIAFGPFLSFGALISIIFGNTLVDLYIKFLL